MVSLLGYRVIDLQAAGFEIWPTFQTPHVTIAFTGDLDERLAALVRAAHEVRTHPYLSPTTNRKGELVAATEVDLIVDLNTMDDTGLPWAFLDEAPDPACIRPGRICSSGPAPLGESRSSSTSLTASFTSARCVGQWPPTRTCSRIQPLAG